jgi:hexokinase
MSKVLLIDIGGTNLRYAYSEELIHSELYDTKQN